MIYVEPTRVVRICDAAIKAKKDLEPKLSEVMLGLDQIAAATAAKSGNKAPQAGLERMTSFMADIQGWLACGHLSCQPIQFDAVDAAALWHIESGAWADQLKSIVTAAEFGLPVPAMMSPHEHSQDRSPTQG